MGELESITEDEFNDIEIAAAKAMREWERGYVCQDINVRHNVGWWIAQEAARRESQKDIWEPIQTAPKDGTPILARYEWQGESRLMVIRRHKEHPWWMADHDSYIKHDDSKDTHRNFGFTHWMPLPNPPKPNKDEHK